MQLNTHSSNYNHKSKTLNAKQNQFKVYKQQVMETEKLYKLNKSIKNKTIREKLETIQDEIHIVHFKMSEITNIMANMIEQLINKNQK
jgi:hypothetical protein